MQTVPRANRRTTPAVQEGRVQKKNGFRCDRGCYYCREQNSIRLVRQRPGAGYRHLLTVAQVRDFLPLIPDWERLSVGLNAIVLAPGEENTDGWHRRSIIALCAWKRDLWQVVSRSHYDAHREIWERLGVPCAEEADGYIRCEWKVETARAYQLLHILPHELGHHHDRMTTRSQKRAARGEPFAEEFALAHEPLLRDRDGRRGRDSCLL